MFGIETMSGDKPKPQSRVTREKLRAEQAKQKRQSKAEEGEAKPAKRKRKEDEILEKCEEDPAFMEFLQAHKKTMASWGNDTIIDDLMKLKEKDKSKKKVSEEEQEEAAGRAKKGKPKVEFFTLKLRDVPKKAKKKDVKAFFHPLKYKSIR